MKNCTHCKWADWTKTSSGRLSPTGDGQCRYPYKVPKLPPSMYWPASICRIACEPKPIGGHINRRKELSEHCPYWQDGSK